MCFSKHPKGSTQKYYHLSVMVLSGLLQICCSSEFNRIIYIDPENGQNIEACIDSNSPNIRCQSLNYTFQSQYLKSSTQYVLSVNGTHQLSFLNSSHKFVLFENLENISLTSDSGINSAVIECALNVGFTFIDVSSLELSKIVFKQCSAEQNSTSRNFHFKEFKLFHFSVGLYFYHCSDVTMTFISVRDNPAGMGVMMFDTDGSVIVSDSIFTNNTISNIRDSCSYPGGGGFYVEFSYCIPGDETCDKYTFLHESRNQGAQYLFTRCTFSNNRANNSDDAITSTYIIPFQSDHEAFGRGGGLSIFFKGNASGNTFNITNCNFTSNKALWGAGLFVEFHDNTADNTVNVSKSTIAGNKCHYSTDAGTGGGGMRIGHYVYTKTSVGIGNRIYLDTLIFDNNSALTGGGLSISPTLQAVGHKRLSNITIFNSTFTKNVARLGAAIHIGRFSLITDGVMLRIMVQDCNISRNSNDYVSRIQGFEDKPVPYQVGIGSVYIKNVDVSFTGNITFTQNNGSSLAAVGSAVNFSVCSAYFSYNTGKIGAGIALLGGAYIKISDFTTMLFEYNRAESEGGAIYNKYIEKENLRSHSNCFIRHGEYAITPDEWRSNFTFVYNYDHLGQHLSAIHTTSILPCSWAGGSSSLSNNVSSVFCWNSGWNYHPGNCTDHISSEVGGVYFDKSKIAAYPGVPFTLPITIQDDLKDNIKSQTVFFVSIDKLNNTIGDNSNFAYITRDSTMIKGSENNSVTLQLDTLGDRVWHMEITVVLHSCPPGFTDTFKTDRKMSENGCKCLESDSTYNGALYCDPDSIKSGLKNKHWIGKLEGEDEYLVSQCPPGYCYINLTSSYIVLHDGSEWNSSQDLDELICGRKHRTNTLCGQCVEGYGPAVNSMSFECIKCTDSDVNVGSNIAKYVFSVYLPLIVLFLVIILFDIRLTTGPANAFILYCQVVASTFDLDADGEIPLDRITSSYKKLLQAYRIPYGIFNLEFIENFLPNLCLGTNLNTLSVFLLDYAVAIFPLVMIVVIVLSVKLFEWLMDKCTCLTSTRTPAILQTATQKVRASERYFTKALLPAFAAFMLLSYTKFSLTSSYLLRYQPFFLPDGSKYNSYRAYFAGQFPISDAKYIRYYVLPAAFVVATFVLIPPLVLLDYPLRAFEWAIGKANCLWKLYPVDKVHLFLDTFQGCYKNKMRFFAGLYFLFRLVVNASYLYTSTWLEKYVVQQLACAFMIMLLSFCQPYNDENKVFNYVDVFIFTNLAAINALSFYMYSFSQSFAHVDLPTSAFAIQYILVFLPLIYMLGYITWVVIITRIVKIYAGRTGFQPLTNVTRNIVTATAPNSHADFGTSTEYMLARAEEENTYKPKTIPGSISSKRTTNLESARPSEDSRFGSKSTKSNSSSSKYGGTGTTNTSNSN